MLDSVATRKERRKCPPLPFIATAIRLRKRWKELAREYLPVTAGDEIWRYSRGWLPCDPDQGWKIHISATILSACDALAAAAPLLRDRGILFKAASTLEELAKLNSGLWYGYSQIGKFITVYPMDEDQFTSILEEIAQLMPAGIKAPSVPFDIQHATSPNLFYRYGSFTSRSLKDEDGRLVPAIFNALGELTEDRRDIACHHWVSLPAELESKKPAQPADSPLTTRYRVFRSISQRGKGGVYEAIDMKSDPPRLCTVKEGRAHGEVAWDGRDGTDRVLNERDILQRLDRRVIGSAAVYDSFKADGNLYLVMEKIAGESLEKFIRDKRAESPFEQRLDIATQIARIVAHLHENGIVWRDCKPSNLILTPDGTVRPIDFEGAAASDSPDFLPWNTPKFTPPELNDPMFIADIESNLPEDLFALGNCIRQIMEESTDRENDSPSRENRSHGDEDRSHNLGSSSDSHETHSRTCEECLDCKEGDRTFPANRRSQRQCDFFEQLDAVVLRLTSDNPAERSSAVETVRILELLERHLPQQIGEADVTADGIEERFDAKGGK